MKKLTHKERAAYRLYEATATHARHRRLQAVSDFAAAAWLRGFLGRLGSSPASRREPDVFAKLTAGLLLRQARLTASAARADNQYLALRREAREQREKLEES